jgi:AraC-like DNA-binding protein
MELQLAAPDPRLAGVAGRYADFAARSGVAETTAEIPGRSLVVIIDLDDGWTVEGRRYGSFVGGLYDRPVHVGHRGSCRCVQVDLEPTALRRLTGVPAGALAAETVELEDLLGPAARWLAERLHDARDAQARFAIVDDLLLRRLADAPPPRRPDVERAWTLLRASRGRVRTDELAAAVGCSRRTLSARFGEEVGVGPKLAARLVRLEHVRARLGTAPLARIAAEHGFTDQAHLSREVRALTGRSPTELLAQSRPTPFPEVQDAGAGAA